MNFNGWLTRQHSAAEIFSTERLVEPGETLPRKVLIERMMNQGVADSVSRAVDRLYMFGAGDEIPDGFIGPLGKYSTDIIDVQNLKRYLAEVIRGNKEKAAEIAAAAAAAKEAALAASQTGSGNSQASATGGNDAGGAQ